MHRWLSPVPVPRGVRVEDLPALLASLPGMSEEEWASFAAGIKAARAELGSEDLRDPWES